MNLPNKPSLSQVFYRLGFVVLFVLAVVSMLAFIRALCYREMEPQLPQKSYADSLQLEQLHTKVDELNAKVDSLILLSKTNPKVINKYLKPRKDSCVIQLNINGLEKNRE